MAVESKIYGLFRENSGRLKRFRKPRVASSTLAVGSSFSISYPTRLFEPSSLSAIVSPKGLHESSPAVFSRCAFCLRKAADVLECT